MTFEILYRPLTGSDTGVTESYGGKLTVNISVIVLNAFGFIFNPPASNFPRQDELAVLAFFRGMQSRP